MSTSHNNLTNPVIFSPKRLLDLRRGRSRGALGTIGALECLPKSLPGCPLRLVRTLTPLEYIVCSKNTAYLVAKMVLSNQLVSWIIEGSLEVKLPTIWRDEKRSREVESEDAKQRRGVESEERRYNCTKVRRKKIHARKMLGKSRNAAFFQGFVGRLGRKVGSLKRRVRSHVIRGDMKNGTPLWREAHFQVKRCKPHHVLTT